MRSLAGTYRDRIRQIRRLCTHDEEFRLLWEDNVAARRAYRHFRSLGKEERADEYCQICDELGVDIRHYLDRQQPHLAEIKSILCVKKKARR
jgi:hypothetical protein